ncbi:mannose-1-phosphate guanylyltransferase/mannose-6-phosphate isomerase [Chlorobium ferrooxidans]|uniref:mannose-1-phosphate guanylyltransferase n=1 Tax=Chlorobium ferrooxidans DSM 13031 TaxID=377431 RepID=Q0YTY9_9CHLB|nr:mannose-1-phosphate guanylyltransferase/mannose-6-phosphate isomerase [Chlorobium ferrooxidans]EAT59763.1 Mannose-1-phosphate guanylyltransferase/mannose-6-phosphate isomerase [Chlorobium ferrooxidans DSM 13031]
MIIPVILSGGSGTRLWPLSRALFPKQFLSLIGEKTMLQDTVLRLASVASHGPVYCVCNESHRFLVAEQLHEINAEIGEIILEPAGRNTAPAAAAAALIISRKHPGALMLVLPADHVILDASAFVSAVSSGLAAAEAGALVTFGIVPASAETGYGYIRASGTEGGAKTTYPVLEFVEKPDQETASRYLESGEYFWNSGIFLFKAESYLQELEAQAPAILEACGEAVGKAVEDFDFLRLDAEAFQSSPSNSIDYAVMEKTAHAVLVPLDAGWRDIGAWSALWDVHDRDEAGNVKKGDVILHDVRNSYIHATSRLVAAVGLEDHIIVETSDAVLVATKDRVQDVQLLVERLNRKERDEAVTHRRVYRPWGSYETVDFSSRFNVKRIRVNPGAALSLQKHNHRAEHWIVVKGTALVTVEEQQITLREDQSTYIPDGSFHRLENAGKDPLELIEVQTGGYLGEDDIVRVVDRYGRQ